MYYFIIIVIVIFNLLYGFYKSTPVYSYAKLDTKSKPEAAKPKPKPPAAVKPKPPAAKPKPPAAKPKPAKPKPGNIQKPLGRQQSSTATVGSGQSKPQAPSTNLLANAKKFFEKNPERVNNPPNAYKGLIEAGYIKKGQGNTFTVNTSPTGKPPARIWPKETNGSKPGGSGSKPTGGSGSKPAGGSGSKPTGNLSGGLANQAWDDYNNKYANKTSVGDAKVVMTDTRMNKFGSDPKKVAEYNAQLVSQGKIPMAYMNTGMVDTPGQVGGDKVFLKLYNDLQKAGVLGKKDSQWGENILDGKKILNDPTAMPKVKAAYTDFIKSMKDLGYKAINVDNSDFYNKGSVNSKLSKADQQKLGQMWQSTVADLIHSQGMFAVAKNAPELVSMPGSTYVQKWDGIVTENAKVSGSDGWNDTSAYKKFADAGKPVWNFQTETGYNDENLPSWMNSYAVGEGRTGWWKM